MSLVLNHFEDTTKWQELTANTGTISERTIDSFKAKCNAENDTPLRTVLIQRR